MNCRDFKDGIYDYLDDSLAPNVRESTTRHLRDCATCREALGREEAAGKYLRQSLERAAAGLTLRPETRAVVARAFQKEAEQPSPLRAWQWLFSNPSRLAFTGAALLAILFVFARREFHHRNPAPQVAKASVQSDKIRLVIDVPLYIQARVFQRREDAVVDAVVPEMAVCHLTIRE